MRISYAFPPLLFVVCQCCLLFVPFASAGQDETNLLETVRKSIDGVETEHQRVIWDQNGLRVEEKPWWEKSLDWIGNLFDGDGKRKKRSLATGTGRTFSRGRRALPAANESTSVTEGEEDPDELVRVNAKIAFYRNGTRLVDIQHGPLITVAPNGQIRVDYRNGTVAELMGGSNSSSRAKRFASLNDLYGAYGLEFERRDPSQFGVRMESNAEPQKIPSESQQSQPSGRADSSSEEEEEKEGHQREAEEWAWAEPKDQKNPYWQRPLYEGAGPQIHQPQGDGGHQPQQIQPPQAAQPSAPKPTWQLAPSNGPSAAAVGPNMQQPQQQQQWPPVNPAQQQQQPIGAQPPSPSPSSWLKSRLQSRQPLSPQEMELAKTLLSQLTEQDRTQQTAAGSQPLQQHHQQATGTGSHSSSSWSSPSASIANNSPAVPSAAGQQSQKPATTAQQATASNAVDPGVKVPDWAVPKR